MFYHLILICFFVYVCYVNASSPDSMTLRFRAQDGSIIRVNDCKVSETLEDILKRNEIETDGMILESCSKTGQVVDPVKSIQELDLKNGSLVSIKFPSSGTTSGLTQRKNNSKAAATHSGTWQPFPSLAKPDYANLVRRAKARANMKNSMSYSDFNDISSALHVVEAQKDGKIKRIYLCADSAQKFQATLVKQSSANPKVALLFGTFHKERETAKRARTSLSSTTDDTKMCEVVKVQALFNLLSPPSLSSPEVKRAIKLAKMLDLSVVGCLYSYDAQNHQNDENIVHGPDILMAAKLQIENMRQSKSSKFVFLAMEANEGATEGFQLSDASVQMIYEGILTDYGVDCPNKLKATVPVLMEGSEVHEVDCLLCLVNTGLLSHKGNFYSRSGSLSKKVKRKLRKKLDDNENGFLDQLCDFSLLLAFDKILDRSQMSEMCDLVTKRVQKRKVIINKSLRIVLETILDE